MSHPLAVYAPRLGTRSETFIHRHMAELLPGKTVIVTGTIEGHWQLDAPVLTVPQPSSPYRAVRVLKRLKQRLNWPHTRNQVIRFWHDHGVQVVLGEFLDASLPWLEVAQQAGVRFFAHAHGYDVSARLRHERLRRAYLAYEKAHGLITMSQVSRQRLIDLGLNGDRIHVIPYGVDVPEEPAQRSPHDAVRCLAVGRMIAKKSPLDTLRAFHQAVREVPALHLDFVGTGELFDRVKGYVADHGLDGQVTLHGSQPHEGVQRLLQQADLFLQHSRVDPETGDEEGLPVAILEAMAWALPVVSTRHAGIPEAVEEGKSGYLVEEGDWQTMAEHMIRLARDPHLRQTMGERGWQRARERFSWQVERAGLLRVLGLSEGPTAP